MCVCVCVCVCVFPQEMAAIEQGMEEQEAIFQQYADECLREYASQGKTTVPMQLMLHKKKGFEVLI